MPENIFAVQTEFFAIIFRLGKTGIREGVDQIKQFVIVQLILSNTIKNTLKLWIGFFNCIKGIVNQPGYRTQFDICTLFILPNG